MSREDVLHTIIDEFEKWSSGGELACKKGCSSCCTQNVTITATEGVEILRYVIKEGQSDWFSEKLLLRDFTPPRVTTNTFARACLEGRDIDATPPQNRAVCPFLKRDKCAIYPVRPFSCRLFVSTETCTKSKPAVVPNHYFEATTVVNQLIEHLGQKEYWGNMLDVLAALLDTLEFKEIAQKVGTTISIQARLQTITAQPLPGFLLGEEDGEKITSLIESIFQSRVDGKSIEDILNGK